MRIEHKKGEMVVTHDSGHVDKYQRADLESEKVNIEQQRARNQTALDAVNSDIQKIKTSIGVI